MLMTIFSFIGVEAWSGAAWLGYGLLASLVMVLALSSYRWLLLYLFGGMAYWFTVELMASLYHRYGHQLVTVGSLGTISGITL